MLVKINKFVFLVDFMVLDCDVTLELPIILHQSFLATRKVLVDLELGEL